MNNAEEFILYNELYKLYDSTKNTSEPFTFWVKKIKTKNNNIFNGGGENNYSNVGIVKIGSSKSKSQFVGFLFTPRNFNSVRLYIEKRHSKEDDNKFIKAANDIGKKITVKQIEDFLKDINSKYNSWAYNVTPENNIGGALVTEMGKLYTDFFNYLKSYDLEKDTCFYEILKIKATELDDNITKNEVLNTRIVDMKQSQEMVFQETTKQLVDILKAAKINTQYWKLNADPQNKSWDMRTLNIGDEIDYDTVNDKNKKLDNFQYAKQGDLVLGYLTGERKIVSLFIVSKPDKDDVIYFKKILNVEPNFLTLDEIKNNQKTQDAFKQLQTTFTKVEYNKFIEIISMMIKKGVLKLEDFQDAIKKVPDIINGDKCNIYHPLNLILYGPPGTGKTYNTLFHALAIIENKKVEDIEAECKKIDELHKIDPTNNPEDGYTKLKGQYDKLVDEGRIVFTTFHQSMSYEDFIEGIKPELDNDPIKAVHKNEVGSATTITQFGDGTTTIDNLSRMKYVVKDGIFKKICYTFQLVVDQFKHKYPIGSVISGSGGASITIRDYKDVYSIPCIQFEWGTKGHTNVVQIRAIQRIIEEGKSFEFDTYEKYCEAISPKGKKGNAATTSHSHYYKIFYNELKKIFDDLKQEKILASSLKKVLIIDEINRGNVAQIFGELITLIEPSKRLGNSEEMKAILPYSSAQKGEPEYFGVPNNLYIIGTMNTADRSVEALDTALRRRFSFEEMMPKPKLLGDKELCDVKLSDLLTTINQRIVALKDREHQIGHSYLMGHDDKNEDGSDKYPNKEEWLTNVFKDKIIPLLQEYFYGDYKKIYYVLGPGFVENSYMGKKENSIRKELFPFVGDSDQDLDIAEERYEIRPFDDNSDNKVVVKAAVHELVSSEEYQKMEETYRENKFLTKDGKKIDVKYVRERIFNGEPESNFRLEEK